MAPVKTASELYGLPLDQFTVERNGLVKRLKAGGEKEEAGRVAKLRKPSTAAWAVNQLVRTQKQAIAELFKSGDQMIKAQARALSGQGSAEALKAATLKQREATRGLLEAATGLLNSDGHELPANVQERVSETLRAAAIDPDSREQVRTGCLAKELQFTGLPGFATAAPGRSATADDKSRRDRDKEKRRAEADLKAAQAHRKDAREKLRQAKADLAGAEQELTAAERHRHRASAAVEKAEQKLAKAEEHLQEAQRGGK